MRTRVYYSLKPFLPLRARIALRRLAARRALRRCADVWPILEAAGEKPPQWPGWPEGREFAFVLSHDVEGPRGLERVRAIAELEMSLGFRSSFNFIPEGSYTVPSELRAWLVRHGFEVGVHDLHHDGKLFRSRMRFERCAPRINEYLRAWNAAGFRSGFMLRNLDWIHDLEIEYDASTFDTDPFEPQPDGVATIFPFWVTPASEHASARVNGHAHPAFDAAASNGHPPATRREGYAELPYTLVQDLNLFVVLRERSVDVWRRKIAWIAGRGGMAHLDTHPDYMAIDGNPTAADEFDVARYREILEHVRDTYEGRYWHALPRDVASFVRTHRDRLPCPPTARHPSPGDRTAGAPAKPTIWIDLDNTPHVPFFTPIVRELEARGYRVVLTARDAFQVAEMAELKGLRCLRIGRHYGKNRFAKVAGVFLRALQLAPVALREKPILAVSHGARSQIIACNLLGIPTVLLADYEHSRTPPLMRPSWELVPEPIPATSCHARPERVRKYPGIKEDVYAWTLEPDSAILESLGCRPGELVIVVRPPATEAHYHNPESEPIFAAVMDRCLEHPNARVILLPRNRRQLEWIRGQWPRWFDTGRVVVPDRAIDGLNLLWHADLVVSGGGTMNREAAALGVPVYSIFRGPTGAVDQDLERKGRLVMIRNVGEVASRLRLEPRVRTCLSRTRGPAIDCILQHIEDIARMKRG